MPRGKSLPLASEFRTGLLGSASASSLDHIDGDPAPEMAAKHLGGPDTAGVLTEYRVVPAHVSF